MASLLNERRAFRSIRSLLPLLRRVSWGSFAGCFPFFWGSFTSLMRQTESWGFYLVGSLLRGLVCEDDAKARERPEVWCLEGIWDEDARDFMLEDAGDL